MLRAAMRMGIAPEAFWRLSLKEWRMLTEAPRASPRMGRAGLAKLMEDWPDGG
ncbi:phage tail assembly chaperone [Brevundimonas sp. SL130]|nr:phage tail assembly chaperone [Brevundimonas sp. SL130]